jgi:hypothetical protein
MALDPNIALGVKGIEVANPMAQYAQVAQLQNMQTQNQLHQMQMREAEATAQERNALRQLNPMSPDYEAQLFRLNPQLGISYRKEASTAAAQEATRQKALIETAAAKQGMLAQARRDISSRPSDANIMAHTEDIQASPLFSEAEKQRALTTQQTLLAMPMAERGAYLASQGAKSSDLKPTVQSVDQYGQKQLLNVPAFGGTPTNIGTYTDVPLPPSVEEQKGRLAKLGAAQTITNVNAFAPASVEAQKQFVQAAADERKVLRNAPDTLTNIDAAVKLIPSASTFMGKGGEPLLAAASFLNNRLGFGISTQGVTDATVLRTRLFEGILDNLKKLDSQPSQEQQRVLSEALGNLGTDPAALEQILNRIGETVRSRVDRFNTDVTDAETRGVKFPFTPQIKLPAPKFAPGAAAAQIPGQGPAPAPAIPPAAIDLLKSGKGTDAQFDAIFGAGAAKRARGGN